MRDRILNVFRQTIAQGVQTGSASLRVCAERVIMQGRAWCSGQGQGHG